MTPSSDEPLIFQQAARHQHDWLLPVMITFSLSLHALSFYLIQAAAPVPGDSAEPLQAKLMVLDSRDAEQQKILSWVHNHDPALLAPRQEKIAPPPALTQVVYQPDYTQKLPQLLAMPDAGSTGGFPDMAPAGPVKIATSSSPSSVSGSKIPASTTKIRFSGGLILDKAQSQTLQPPKITGAIPSATRILIEVGANGQVRYVFIEDSSGQEVLDACAIQWLKTRQFSNPTQNTSLMGQAIISWGGEIFQNSPK